MNSLFHNFSKKETTSYVNKVQCLYYAWHVNSCMFVHRIYLQFYLSHKLYSSGLYVILLKENISQIQRHVNTYFVEESLVKI